MKKLLNLHSRWPKIHFIGHSLGAHVSGLAARELKKDGIIIDRITGLDPAEPFFETENTDPSRLSRRDANFVDVIHSDGSVARNGGLGLLDPIG